MTMTRAGGLIASRYEVGPVLRRGGMADVHSGRDRRLEREVAVKLLRPDMADRPDVRLRFEAEARSAAKLSHPNVVAVFDTGEFEGTPYIVMERLPGRTLADLIADGPVEPEWLLSAAQDVLSALAAAHNAGIVHRDVKPGNILLTDTGVAKIADFGIAKSAELASGAAPGTIDLTITGQLVGTPAYLAPERLAGAPATFLSDLYSMGVVLYEALTAQKPFAGSSFVEVAQAVQAGQHRPLADAMRDLDRDLVPAVATAVERAMDRDPSRRFSSAEDMAGALAGGAVATTVLPVDGLGEETTLLGTDDIAATQVNEAPPIAAAEPRRHASLVVPLVAAGALLVLLLMALALSGGQAPAPASNEAPVTTAPVPTTVTTVPAETVPPTVTRPAPRRDAPRTNGKKGHRGGN